MKSKLLIKQLNEIQYKNSFSIVYYHGNLLTTAGYCRILYTLAALCLILLKYSKLIQNGWWIGLRLKMGPLEYKNHLFVQYHSCKMTEIWAKVCSNLKQNLHLKMNKIRLQIQSHFNSGPFF